MDESEFKLLREKARAMIAAGTIASTEPTSVIGDRVPSATKCSLCGEFIPQKGFQYVVRAPGKGMGDQHYGLHFLCHAAWQIEVAASEQD